MAKKKSSEENAEKIGFHKGSLATLGKEREELCANSRQMSGSPLRLRRVTHYVGVIGAMDLLIPPNMYWEF